MSVFNQKEKFWHGPELNRNSIFNPNNGVGDIIFDGLKNHLDLVSQINDENGSQLTCKEILEKSINVAENLKGMGFRQGDVFSVISRNNDDVAPLVFGLLFLGASLNTLDVTLNESDFLHIFKTVKPKLIFVDPVCLANVRSCMVQLPINSIIFTFQQSENISEIPNVRSLFAQPEIRSTGPYFPERIPHPSTTNAFVLCTSGITGPIKIVCLSHSQVISEVLRIWDWSISSSDICFNFASLFWVSGIGNLLIATVKGATRVITTKPYSSDMFLDLIKKHKITQVCLPNTCINDVISNRKIDETDLSSLKYVIIGGSTVYDQVKDVLKQKLNKCGTKVVEVYGFIELGSLSSNTLYGTKKGSCGIVASQNLIKIINEKGKSLGPREIGEICAKNTCKFLGYYNNEELTKQTVDSNGWIRSGDLGFFDDDGYLFIKGKIKELITCKGHTVSNMSSKLNNINNNSKLVQISPEAIESMIQQKLGISQVCAIRIEDDRQSDDLPAVVIKLPPGYAFKEDEVNKMAHEAVSGDFALTGGIYFVNEFPMTPSGKVKRGALKELANGWYNEQMKKLEKERRKNEPAPMYFY